MKVLVGANWNSWVREFSRGGIFQGGGSLMGTNFPGGSFPHVSFPKTHLNVNWSLIIVVKALPVWDLKQWILALQIQKTFLKNRSGNGHPAKLPLEMFYNKGVLKNFTRFTEKHLCQRLFFCKVPGLRPETLLKKSLWHRCFPEDFTKFLKTSFLQNTFGRLLHGKKHSSSWLFYLTKNKRLPVVSRFPILLFETS